MVKNGQNRPKSPRRRNNSGLRSQFMVLGTRFVNFFVEYLPVLFSDSGARDQRVCLRMGQVDRKLSRELSEGGSDSTPSYSISQLHFQTTKYHNTQITDFRTFNINKIRHFHAKKYLVTQGSLLLLLGVETTQCKTPHFK